jgi:anti-anti-sigma regulatory factor
MTDEVSQIVVSVMGEAAVVRFRRTECLLQSRNPREDVGNELVALVEKDHYSLIIIDFDNPDILWLSAAFLGLLVLLRHRIIKANGVLKLCHLPDAMRAQLRTSRLDEVFNIYPNVEAALNSDQEKPLPP